MKCDKTNRRKTLDEFALEAEGNEEEASLSLFDLLCIGIGGTVGSGVFVLTGEVYPVAGPSSKEHWAMMRSLVEGVRAAGGTWAAYARLPRRRVLRLRSLVARGRARTADPIIEPVFRLPNEMCWHVLEFWRATCPTTGEVL